MLRLLRSPGSCIIALIRMNGAWVSLCSGARFKLWPARFRNGPRRNLKNKYQKVLSKSTSLNFVVKLIINAGVHFLKVNLEWRIRESVSVITELLKFLNAVPWEAREYDGENHVCSGFRYFGTQLRACSYESDRGVTLKRKLRYITITKFYWYKNNIYSDK